MAQEQQLESRLVDLEIRLAHQEAALDELTRALLAQEQFTQRQALALERLEAQLRAVQATSGPAPEDGVPPHY